MLTIWTLHSHFNDSILSFELGGNDQLINQLINEVTGCDVGNKFQIVQFELFYSYVLIFYPN